MSAWLSLMQLTLPSSLLLTRSPSVAQDRRWASLRAVQCIDRDKFSLLPHLPKIAVTRGAVASFRRFKW